MDVSGVICSSRHDAGRNGGSGVFALTWCGGVLYSPGFMPSSSRKSFFTAAITGVISGGSTWMNLRRISSSSILALHATDISSCWYAEGLSVICALAINFSNIPGLVLSCLVKRVFFSLANSVEAIIVESRLDTSSEGKSDKT